MVTGSAAGFNLEENDVIDHDYAHALVERLQFYSQIWRTEPSVAPHPATSPGFTTGTVIGVTQEAAATITALLAENERLQAERDAAWNDAIDAAVDKVGRFWWDDLKFMHSVSYAIENLKKGATT